MRISAFVTEAPPQVEGSKDHGRRWGVRPANITSTPPGDNPPARTAVTAGDPAAAFPAPQGEVPTAAESGAPGAPENLTTPKPSGAWNWGFSVPVSDQVMYWRFTAPPVR